LIVIIARFETKPDYSERWPELVAPLIISQTIDASWSETAAMKVN
jgi:hypothetical protein